VNSASGNWRRQLKVWLASTLGVVAYRALASTWRYRVQGGEPFDACVRDGKPAAFALWHGEMLPLIWHWRGRGIRALISTHSDGEIIARIVERIGYRTARGSSSHDGTRALRELIGSLKDRQTIAVTPDGPRGPRHVFAAGVLLATHRASAPIILGRATADRAWILRSWDRFLIPKPFARVDLVHSPLVFAEAADAEEEARRFAGMLDALAPDSGIAT
jgi:lysophospholipid acyltransferase (LPLAT)-like uncharacterized protein